MLRIQDTKSLSLTKILGKVASDRKQNTIWVGESGLFTHQDLEFVASCGVNAVLVGESLVKQPDIEQAVKLLLFPSR